MSKSHNNQNNSDITEDGFAENNVSEESTVESEHSGNDSSKPVETDNLAEQPESESQKYDELKDSYLRLMAEFDNYRKRTLREKSELIKSAGEDVLVGLLPVIDDFERGLEVIKTTSDSGANMDGIELIYNKFISYLSSRGVKNIETDGKEFDTECHEAVTAIPAPTPELKGKIVDCILKGYTLNDKVIRYAKVVVGE